jgi:hypothetical protein
MIAKFLKNNWYFIVMLAMLITIYVLYKRAQQTPPPPDTTVIDRLHKTVDSLVDVNEKLQIAYDNKQLTIINNITYKNAQDVKNITNIPNLNAKQRDSLWTRLTANQDSIPGGYWNILKQKTGGRTPKELVVQKPVSK